MKKLILGLPLIVGAAAVAGTSQYAGALTESEYQAFLEQLNGLSPLVFVNEEYNSGLTSSSAVTNVMASSAADAEVVLRLQHDIKHAPVRVGGDGVDVGTVKIYTRIHDELTASSEIMDIFSDPAPFLLDTEVDFNGKVTNQIRVSAVSIDEDGETIAWTGLDFDGVTKDGATVGTGTLGSLTFSDESTGGKVSMEDSQMKVDVQYHGDSIFTGTGNLALEKVGVVSPDLPVPVFLASVELDSTTDIQGEALNSRARFSLNGIESPLALNNASIDVNVNGLLIEGMRQYNKMMKYMGSKPDTILEDPDFGQKMLSAIFNILAPGSAMKYAVALDNNEGDVGAVIRLAVKDASAEGMSADALQNIVTGRDLLNILALDGKLDADVAALSQTPVMMMLGAAGEFVTVTDESITSDLSLDGTMLTVNGIPVPLDEMTNGMLDLPFSSLMP